jgi:hypothetical protein
LAQVQRPAAPLTNAEVIEMMKAKLSSEAIIAKIQISRCHFDTNPTILAELKYRGVPDAIITAMVEAPDLVQTLMTSRLCSKSSFQHPH